MDFKGFIGGSYESRAFTADQEHTVNWIVEDLKSPGATSKRAFMPTPGVEVIADVASHAFGGPGRAHYAINGREFAVIGGGFFEFASDGTVIASSGLSGVTNQDNDGIPATISCNGDGGGQLFITANGNGYTYDLTVAGGTAVARQTELDGKAHFGGHLDGYFVALDTNTSTLYVSELYDGTTWNTGTEFAQRSLGPDKWKSMEIAGRAVWLYGELTSEVWYNTGDRFPLSPLANQVIPYGTTAPHSAKTVGGDVLWLSASVDGKVCVLRASGMSPEVVSTPALEAVMQSYLGRVSAVADGYTDEGHSFYMLNFDVDNITWCYDTSTGLWHQRGTWSPESNQYVSFRPRFHAYAFGEHRMLDTSNTKLYRVSSSLQRDVDGRLIRRLRRAPAISNENRRVFYSELELDLQPGVGESRSIVGFTMEAEVGSVTGTVFDDGDLPVEDAQITVTVDGVVLPIETTTDADGEFTIGGLPVGTVVIYANGNDVDGTPMCGSAGSIDNDPVADITGIELGITRWTPTWCADTTEVGAPSLFDVTLVPDAVGLSCGAGVEYFWSIWNNNTSEAAPAATSTDPSPTFLAFFSEGGMAKLRVTDPTTGWTLTIGPYEYLLGPIQCP